MRQPAKPFHPGNPTYPPYGHPYSERLCFKWAVVANKIGVCHFSVMGNFGLMHKYHCVSVHFTRCWNPWVNHPNSLSKLRDQICFVLLFFNKVSIFNLFPDLSNIWNNLLSILRLSILQCLIDMCAGVGAILLICVCRRFFSGGCSKELFCFFGNTNEFDMEVIGGSWTRCVMLWCMIGALWIFILGCAAIYDPWSCDSCCCGWGNVMCTGKCGVFAGDSVHFGML